MIDIVFLGTSSMFPTKERAQSCVYLKHGSENILFDCGEGAQRQMRIAGLTPTKIDKIFITHWHGDHALGLAGIIQSLSASGRKTELEVFGPQGTSQKMYHLIRSFSFDLTFKIKTTEIMIKEDEITKVLDLKDIEIYAMEVKHIIPCLAYSFVKKGRRRINIEYTKKFGLTRHPLLGKLQKGEAITYKGVKLTPEKATYMTEEKKVTYIVDTTYFKKLNEFAKNSDLLICEATYSAELEKKAKEHHHLTAKQAAQIAKDSKSKKLILTHFSQRYKDLTPLEKEAKKVFKDSALAKDFLKIRV